MIRHCPCDTPVPEPPTKEAIEQQRLKQIEALKDLRARLVKDQQPIPEELARQMCRRFEVMEPTAA